MAVLLNRPGPMMAKLPVSYPASPAVGEQVSKRNTAGYRDSKPWPMSWHSACQLD